MEWEAEGFGRDDLDQLIVLMLRFVQSMIIDPPGAGSPDASMRSFLRRWIALAVSATG